ncbi:domain of Kin17 curved DNA-binding protein-domain-containing protein [Limtongia smithiae]|uniref:domain of Kin17 curved DNA-binding protein-domain-containing protein n=1 Tax=Limtongia smithiae TaxID=1125753 RepID=UPI0034CF2F50
MPRAEVGTPKYIANKMKAKGLQRLRWYCQVCEKQCRDENGFRCHTQSESHVRQMLLIGENPQRKIAEYTANFVRDFVSLLKSSHGEKPINANRFYQEYIMDRNHVHMNATRFTSLSEFVKYLGEQNMCFVAPDPEKEGGMLISYVDSSPEAVKRRQDAARREKADVDDIGREEKVLAQQVKRAQKESAAKRKDEGDGDATTTADTAPSADAKKLQRTGEPIKLGFSLAKKPIASTTSSHLTKKIKMR